MVEPLRQSDVSLESSWLLRYAARLSKRSIIAAAVSQLPGSRGVLDDHAGHLARSPLGMFFYNQRALFFAFGLLYLVTLQIAAVIDPTPDAQRTILLLAAFWVIGALLTLAMHRSFLTRVRQHLGGGGQRDFPDVFYAHFVLDCVLVIALLLVAPLLGIDVHYFAFLMLANTTVYVACSGQHVTKRWADTFAAVLACIFTAFLVVERRDSPFAVIRDIGPVLGVAAVVVAAVAIISALRQREHAATHRQIELLGRVEEVLSGAGLKESLATRPSLEFDPRGEFDRRLRRCLRLLSTAGEPIWYEAGRLWFVATTVAGDDKLIAGPYHNLPHVEHDTVDVSPATLAGWRTPVLISAAADSVGAPSAGAVFNDLPPAILDTPPPYRIAATVPIIVRDRPVAVMSLYGTADSVPDSRHEPEFLRSLSAIVADTFDQWETRHVAQAREAIDELFHCATLDEVYARAASLIAHFSHVQACAIMVRNRRGALVMRASVGLRRAKRSSQADADPDTQAWLDSTDTSPENCCASDSLPPQLAAFVKSLCEDASSSLSVPLVGARGTRGVVTLFDRAGRVRWFTRDDTKLACALVHGLQRLVERFHQEEDLKQSLTNAERHAAHAQTAKQEALAAAEQRRDDLMVITHQLQAPLTSIRASTLRLKRHIGEPDLISSLDHIQGLIEDSLALCYGTVTTFAQEAGRRASFGTALIDAPKELEKLCLRMRMTNARDDLRFDFKSEPGFPPIKMDRDVFTSVFYSLVHNAMKYAEPHSRVTLECGFERDRSDAAALKVKTVGEPILFEERDVIFNKYRRGKTIASTGRHHAGVGLGLWVARELMRAVGGDLTVELADEFPNLSVFVVHCPVARAASGA